MYLQNVWANISTLASELQKLSKRCWEDQTFMPYAFLRLVSRTPPFGKLHLYVNVSLKVTYQCSKGFYMTFCAKTLNDSIINQSNNCCSLILTSNSLSSNDLSRCCGMSSLQPFCKAKNCGSIPRKNLH